MSLFFHTSGRGPDLLLIHGWGMNGDVWEGLLPALEPHFRVTIVDLPGHGRSVDDFDEFTLPTLAADIADIAPDHASIVGWSLGGQIATQFALDYPQRINKLTLVASSPRFVRSDDWPNGVAPEVLNGFAEGLISDFQATLRRFIAIQAMGSEHAREQQRDLRERVFRHGKPQLRALEGGLQLLQHTDLRPQLSRLDCDTLLISGEHDALFRLAAAQQTLPLIPHATLNIIKGAGHAPFLSHPDVFLHSLTQFLQQNTP
ncbi:MAG: pimeloyl-ACP methyl ester esterase BioH [Gammaproteobacteria bacterium]|nr:pimeloyl-ACP methyl ester esterase BioH [Gammaproteobacteria bacterium]